MTYIDTEEQLFANMHLSATQTMISALIKGDVDPNKAECLIAYGTILKPASNVVMLYKMVGVFNKETYIQIDYMINTIYWHIFFDRVLMYTFNKLCVGQ